MERLRSIEKRMALQVLVYLYESGAKNWNELNENLIGSENTLNTSLTSLGDNELIHDIKNPRPFRIISLTEKGSQIAKHLVEVRNILKAS